jgi:trimeric autotransporter adhesin
MLCWPSATATAQTVSPVAIGFGNWVVQTRSTAKTVVLTNTQTTPLTISSITVLGDFGETSKCPLAPKTLAAAASCNISVTFAPTTLGSRTGTLSINDNSSNSPQTVQLSGSGGVPASLSSATVAFGNQFVKTTSAAKTVTFQNNQTVPLTISAISTSGDYAQTSNCPISPNTLAAKLSCKINLTFSPTILGSRPGTLTVTDTASNSPQTAQLSGAGTAPVSLSPANLAFASQVVSIPSGKKSVTLKNNQTVPLMISNIATSGDFAESSTCPLSPSTLGAGASCIISVTFTPAALGTRTGTLTISDGASTSPQTGNLTGTGTLSGLLSISVTPASPKLVVGSQQQFVATGTWSGGVNASIGQFVTWSSSAPSIAPVNSTGAGQAVSPGVASVAATYGSISGATTVTVAPPTLTSITVTPANTSVPAGGYEQLTAVLGYSDGTTKEATGLVSWSSSAANVASITGSGLVGAVAAGNTTITAAAESVVGSTTLSVSQPQCVAPPPGLIGWWTGDGNTIDIGASNSGTLQNGTTYENGEVGQAFSFSGNNASVLINSPVYSPTAGTVMFWFLPNGAGWMTGSYDGTNRTPGFSVDGYGNSSWEFATLSAQSLGQVGLNQWSHLALSYSTSQAGVNVNVYLNGNLAASAVASQNSSWHPQVAFGGYLGAQQPSFNGAMDEVAIFNQALGSQQIQQIYNAFSAGMCKPALQSIAVNPPSPAIAAGLSQQFGAAGSYSDGTVHDLTTSASWTSSNPPVATVSGTGQASALSIGSATITATLGEESGSGSLSVVPSLVSLAVNPQNSSIAAGTTQPFTATGTFSDSSTRDLTASVNWGSSLPSVATIAAGGVANGISVGQTTITATAGAINNSAPLTVTQATLSAVTVNPGTATIAAGTTQTFTATGWFSDGTTQDVTTSVTWNSSMPSVATIGASGVGAGLAPGQTTITASLGSVLNSVVLTITPAVLTGITVNPVNPFLLIGSTQQFTATGTFSDNSTQDVTGTANWNSSNANVANVSTGLASGVTAGTSLISATLGSISGSSTLTVTTALQSISLTPTNPVLGIGQNQQLVATGLYADGSTQDLSSSANWSSSQPSVAAIMTAGLVSGLSGGSTTITAVWGTISGSALLTVNLAPLTSIAVTPGNPSIALGTSQVFAATGTYGDGSTLDLTTSAAWSSSLPAVATANTKGLVTSASTGQTTITAAAAGISGSSSLNITSAALVSIALTPAIQTIPLGATQQLTATGTFTDGSTQTINSSVQWISSDGTVATISNDAGSAGLVTSAGTGSSTISATSGAISGSTTLTVSSAELVAIAVNPSGASIALGTTQQFTAIGQFTDGSTQDLTASATWGPANGTVASVSTSALATSLAVGTATITATVAGINGSTALTVSPASVVSITVSPGTAAIPIGLSQGFTALGTFSDGTMQDVTSSAHWSSSAPNVTTISNTPGSNGTASGAGSGTATISAMMGAATGSGSLTVTSAVLAAIEISPQGPSVPTGAVQQFTATGLYTDGTTANISTSATWGSSSSSVASISNSAGSQGLAASAGVGTSRISASLGSLTASTTLVVQDQLSSISISPTNISILAGAEQPFTATGTYLSGLTQDLTDSVLWNSSATTVATIAPDGVAASVGAGQTTINATMGSVAASASLTVGAVDALGTANGVTISCPSGGLTGASCYAVTISCPNVSNFTGYIKANYANGSAVGTVLLSGGGNGTGLYEAEYTYGPTLLNSLLQGGFNIAQITWGEPFAKQPSGWQTGPGGIRAVACRYATLAQWTYTNVHQANTQAPFCATGNSAGAAEIGQAMAHYGLGSIFAMVEPTSGPPFSRQDWACDCLHPSSVNACGNREGYCVGVQNAENFIDPAYSAPLCSQEAGTHTTTYDATFLQDSVMAPDATLSYPNTYVKFLYGGQDLSGGAPNQGQLWQNAITSSKASACVADAPHDIASVLDGAQQIANDMFSYCKLPAPRR